ncbi:hypothetical protein [Rubellimicrobium sp. CFH 75288]|uniref:hypothetical protein n=1 Tax=Rubellimicrobium sp. CFH 75288 TaxID=2697034 RepID=UPI0014125BCB|nr:hypothetical protein [Rubellimicrobium sp. CFH 75288]NAZ38161.1 hypothetical protein [Rubellimicrobium sp. CFH 75288]
MSLNMTEQGTLKVSLEGDWASLAIGTKDLKVLHGLVMQLALLGEGGQRISETATNQALAFMSEMKPRDAAELFLLAQMASIHQATMMLSRRLNHVETIPQQDAAERALNKLARTFAGQMEALKRYRSKGHQTVRVERVTVQSGGQAVVGTIAARGRGEVES